MIRFEPVPEPAEFHERVRARGDAWLVDNPDAKRPRAYWTPFKEALAQGFRDLCAYSVMYEPVGTVDHFVSWHEDRSQAYEWSNYRYCAAWINSTKGNTPAAELLDPFEIEDGWFELHLPSLQLEVSDTVPDQFRERAEHVLNKLHLRDDERVIRQRSEWYRMYRNGELSLDGLGRKAPLIALAVSRA